MEHPKKKRNYLEELAILVAGFSWFWIIGIILNGDVQDYVKWACGLYLVSTSYLGYLKLREKY